MASVELATGYVTLAASTSQLAKDVGRIFAGAETQAGKTGKAMGSTMAKAFDSAKPDVDALRKEVEVAEKRVAAQVEASAKKQEAAKRKVEIAQAKVNEATEKFGPKSSQALSAVDRLATAEQKLEAESLAAASAQNKLEKELREAQGAVEKAAQSSETASKQYAKGWKGVGQRVKDHLKRGVKGATDDAEDVAERGGKESAGAFSGAFKGAMGALGAVFAVDKIKDFVASSITGAGELEQSIGAIDSVFKGSAKQMHGWAQTAASDVGLTKNEFNELGTLIGAQLKNGGTAMDELAPKTQNLIGLGADLSSMFGGTTADAVGALSSALKGERDPIERYGVSLNQAKIDAEAAALGYKKVGKSFEGNAIQAATLSLIMKQTADAHGNFAKESDTFAHKQQVMGAKWEDLKTKVGEKFMPAMTNLFGFIGEKALPALDDMSGKLALFGDWVQKNAGWLVPLTSAVIGYAFALGTLSIIGKIKAAMGGLTIAQWALNTAMSANPIGLIVAAIVGLIAGLVWAYNNVGWFRDMVDTAFKFIGDVINNVVTWFRDTAVPWFQDAIANLGGFFTKLYQDWIKPAIDAVASVINWLWTNIIKPVWGFISGAVKAAWLVIRGIFQVIKSVIETVLAPVFKWLYETIIKPVFDGIKNAIKWAWGNVIKPVFDTISKFVKEKLGPAFEWFGDKVVPVWEAIKKVISDFWENTLKPTAGFISKTITETIPNAFEKGVGMIEDFWNGLKEIAKAPVKFVIETVLNNGLIAGFNTIADILPGVDRLPKIDLPPGFANGGYTGDGHKYKPAGVVHAGEYVFTKEQTRKAGVGTLAAYAKSLSGYAKGGFVHPIPGAPVTSPYGMRTGGFHNGIDFGMPAGTPVRAAGDGVVQRAGWTTHGGGNQVEIGHPNGLVTWYSHLSSIAVRAGQAIKAAMMVGRVGSTGNSTGPHLHYMVMNGGYPNHRNPANYLSGGGEGGGWFDPLGAIKGFFTDKLKGLGGGGFMVDIAAGVGRKVLDTILGWVKGGGGTDAATVYDDGGWLVNTGGPQLVNHKSRKPDAVLTNREWEAVYQIVEDNARGGITPTGTGGDTYNIGNVGYDPSEIFRRGREEKRRAMAVAGL